MTTTETLVVHPGDIVQTSDGLLHLVASTHRWGVGAVLRWTDRGDQLESYSRLKPGQFVVVGTAHLLPKEVAQLRRDSLATARAVERDQEQVSRQGAAEKKEND